MQTIRARLTLAYAALLLTTLVALSVALYVGMAHALRAAALDSVVSLADQAVHLVAAGSSEGDHHGIGLDLTDTTLSDTLARGGLLLEVRAPDGRVLSSSATLRARSLVDPQIARSSQTRRSFTRNIAGAGEVLIYVEPVYAGGRFIGVVAAGRSMADTTSALGNLRALLAGGDAFALVLAVFGGWWMAGAALRPVDRITRAARSISAGGLSQRLQLAGPDDELHRLAAAFDDMLERLERAFDRERQFTGDAAHELKSPLTVLRGEIEVALRRPREAEEYRRILLSLGDEVRRLSRLVDSLLLLARTDAGNPPAGTQPIRLGAFFRDAAARFAERSTNDSVTLKLRGDDDVTVDADPERLNQVIDNLLDNARRHTPADQSIELHWYRQDDSAVFEVVDTGGGIPPEHLPQLFKRFYRVDTHRSRDSGGTGLGLAIVKQIVESHGGEIGITSHLGTGTTVTVRMPRSG